MSRWCDGQASPRPHWIETLLRGLNQLTNLWRELLEAAAARVATGLSVTGCRSYAADLTSLGLFTENRESQWEVALRLRRSPRTNLSDRVLEPGVRRHAL